MTKNTTRTFAINDQVRMVQPPNYNPADHNKDVSGIVGVVTGIDKHFTYESLWLYAVTFPRYHEYQVFKQQVPPVEVEEEITLTFWNEQIELVDVESEQGGTTTREALIAVLFTLVSLAVFVAVFAYVLRAQ